MEHMKECPTDLKGPELPQVEKARLSLPEQCLDSSSNPAYCPTQHQGICKTVQSAL